ncbi:MAG: 50S ribosomal protein L15 [Planctomycetes bacterium]|nr:50S ribosomal protein L15 [Planctomycetota bacterium]
MNLTDAKKTNLKRKRRRIIGRGTGSGRGKTAAKGHKGQRARSGYSVGAFFEGGQMPLIRRIPKRGFNKPQKRQFNIVNLSDINDAFEANSIVDVNALKKTGLIKNEFDGIKILGNGNITKPLSVYAHKFSKSAIEKITKNGGKVNILK